jgi:hypothetical protein
MIHRNNTVALWLILQPITGKRHGVIETRKGNGEPYKTLQNLTLRKRAMFTKLLKSSDSVANKIVENNHANVRR